jgi:hypothetical protein
MLDVHSSTIPGPAKIPAPSSIRLTPSAGLAELAKGQPLPVAELARRLRETPSSMSKHVAILRRSGIISHGTGSRDYRIPEAYQVPGERAVDLAGRWSGWRKSPSILFGHLR